LDASQNPPITTPVSRLAFQNNNSLYEYLTSTKKKCLANQYLNSNTNTCSICSPSLLNCSLCLNTIKCAQCNTGYLLEPTSGQCFQSCNNLNAISSMGICVPPDIIFIDDTLSDQLSISLSIYTM
jgi:hypothetical protein